MYVYEYKTKENNNWGKDKIEPQHVQDLLGPIFVFCLSQNNHLYLISSTLHLCSPIELVDVSSRWFAPTPTAICVTVAKTERAVYVFFWFFHYEIF